MNDRQVCLVVGAGDSTGGAIARRFAREGFVTCVTRRDRDKLAGLCGKIESAGGEAHAYGSDARREEQVIDLIESIESDIGPIEVAVFNIGGNINFSILEFTARKFYKVWEMGCFAGFLMGREVAKRMVPRGNGTILFTGATASIRGGSGYAGFAAAKFGLRALSQSMARELGPLGIHVAHVIIDGMIDTPWIRENFAKEVAAKPPDGLLSPDSIAENYWMLHRQPRSAWSQELDLRPWAEHW